jgi:predicted GIY-YIG superfamily endonuclease
MRYVYLLQSVGFPGRRYVGSTRDLEKRLREHNAGACPSTTPWAPWQVLVVVRFTDERRGVEFERYLKTGSGHAFSGRHFWPPHLGQPRQTE